MRTGYGKSSSALGPALIAGAVLVTGLVVTVGALAASGRIELPFWKRKSPAAPPAGPPEGTLAVPVTIRAVPAYTRLTRDHFWDAKAGKFAVVHLYPREVLPGMLTGLDQILGRVLAMDKR